MNKNSILIYLAITVSITSNTIYASSCGGSKSFNRLEFPHWKHQGVIFYDIKSGKPASQIIKAIYAKEDYISGRFNIKDTGACIINTRHKVLLKEGHNITVTSGKNKMCKITSGWWTDYYTGEKLTTPEEIDIDHVVPLKEAWCSGAYKWNKEKRIKFANDEGNLYITHRSLNRSKGDRTLEEWLPQNNLFACYYIKTYGKVKDDYSLTHKIEDIEIMEDYHGDDVESPNGKLEEECHIRSRYRENIFGWSEREMLMRN